MTGLVRSTVSPSSSSMSRSTPWVEGCWGPMLMIIVSSSDARCRCRRVEDHALGQAQDRADRELDAGPRRGQPAPGRPRRSRAGVHGCAAGADHEAGRRSSRPRCFLELHRHPADAVVLAQRVALPVLGHEDPGQVGVAGEDDARTGRRPRAPWPRCPGRGRRGSGPTGSDSGTWTRTRTRRCGDSESRLTTTSNRSGATPSGSAPAGVAQVVDRADVDAHLEALGRFRPAHGVVVLVAARRRGPRGVGRRHGPPPAAHRPRVIGASADPDGVGDLGHPSGAPGSARPRALGRRRRRAG